MCAQWPSSGSSASSGSMPSSAPASSDSARELREVLDAIGSLREEVASLRVDLTQLEAPDPRVPLPLLLVWAFLGGGITFTMIVGYIFRFTQSSTIMEHPSTQVLVGPVFYAHW